MKYKVGDKIECISPYQNYIVGKVYEVYDYQKRGPGYETVTEGDCNQVINHVNVNSHFKLVKNKVPKVKKEKEGTGWGF